MKNASILNERGGNEMTEERGTYAAGKDYPEQDGLRRWEKAMQAIQRVLFANAEKLTQHEIDVLKFADSEVIQPNLNRHLEARRQWYAGRMERHKEGL